VPIDTPSVRRGREILGQFDQLYSNRNHGTQAHRAPITHDGWQEEARTCLNQILVPGNPIDMQREDLEAVVMALLDIRHDVIVARNQLNWALEGKS